MKIVFLSLLMISSVSAFASAKPCLTQARQEVSTRIASVVEDSDCEVKLSKVHQSDDEVSYSADISCVNGGGFFDMSDFIVMKYKKLPSGTYSCKVQ